MVAANHASKRWISKTTANRMTPRPSDIMPLDLLLWVYLKSNVYVDRSSVAISKLTLKVIHKVLSNVPANLLVKRLMDGISNI